VAAVSGGHQDQPTDLRAAMSSVPSRYQRYAVITWTPCARTPRQIHTTTLLFRTCVCYPGHSRHGNSCDSLSGSATGSSSSISGSSAGKYPHRPKAANAQQEGPGRCPQALLSPAPGNASPRTGRAGDATSSRSPHGCHLRSRVPSRHHGVRRIDGPRRLGCPVRQFADAPGAQHFGRDRDLPRWQLPPALRATTVRHYPVESRPVAWCHPASRRACRPMPRRTLTQLHADAHGRSCRKSWATH
jgi:hypothetical protein